MRYVLGAVDGQLGGELGFGAAFLPYRVRYGASRMREVGVLGPTVDPLCGRTDWIEGFQLRIRCDLLGHQHSGANRTPLSHGLPCSRSSQRDDALPGGSRWATQS